METQILFNGLRLRIKKGKLLRKSKKVYMKIKSILDRGKDIS